MPKSEQQHIEPPAGHDGTPFPWDWVLIRLNGGADILVCPSFRLLRMTYDANRRAVSIGALVANPLNKSSAVIG